MAATSARAVVVALLCMATAACSSSPADNDASNPSDAVVTSDGSADALGDGALADPDPVFTPAEQSALRALHYDPSPPPADPSNRLADDPRARAFGHRLFFDPSLSGALLDADNDGTDRTLGRRLEPGRVSCAGCHIPTSHFVDTRSPHRQISLGAQWTQRRSPTLLDIAFVPLLNWDGRRDTLWNQAVGVMENDREFNAGRLFVALQTYRLHRAEYEALYGPMPALDDSTRYPQLTPSEAGCRLVTGAPPRCRGIPGDNADYDSMTAEAQDNVTRVTVNVAKAMEAYLRLLRCGASPFDRWLDGDNSALSRAAQRGAALFVGRARCVSCHSGSRLTDDQFHNVGLTPAIVATVFSDVGDRGAIEGIAAALTDPLNSRGRYSDGDRNVLPAAVTPSMDGAFRTPTLRCIATQPSFMHTAQYQSLEDVVNFFSRGGHAPGGYPGVNELMPLNLSARERTDLVEFLRSLQGPGADAALLHAP